MMKWYQKTGLVIIFFAIFALTAFQPTNIYAAAESTSETIAKTLMGDKELSLKNKPIVKDGEIFLSLNDLKEIGFSFDDNKTKNVIYINDLHSNLKEVKKVPTTLTLYFNNTIFKTETPVFTLDKITYVPVKQMLESLYFDVVYDEDTQTLNINQLVTVTLSNDKPIKNEKIIITVKSKEYDGLPFTAKVSYKTVTTDLSGKVGTPLDFKIGTATKDFKVRIEVKIDDDKERIAPASFVPQK